MLKTRIVTALVMLAVFIPALLFLSPAAFSLLMGAVIALAFWEWGAFLAWSDKNRKIAGFAVFALCAAVVFLSPEIFARPPFWCVVLYAASAAFWIFAAPLWLYFKWRLADAPAWFGATLGALILLPLWLAISQTKAFSWELLIVAMAIVWIADSVAYFVGRAVGRHKLAPAISPGKSWEGAAGGTAGVVFYFLILGKVWEQAVGLEVFIFATFAGAFFAAISIVGDLLESLFKRQAGIKDSSGLLPGHGGFLDRFDSLAAVLPLFWLCFLLMTVNA